MACVTMALVATFMRIIISIQVVAITYWIVPSQALQIISIWNFGLICGIGGRIESTTAPFADLALIAVCTVAFLLAQV